ncbi:tail tape measure protein [Polymorphobacter fuscus]|uniref:Tail tape measure protein n=1 Tax=Sandarakinorhabdus fusca TaxID=1439888 RepID=A0A7C9KW69_9SPHN|nr:tail tape measure protein [Polymorphobacter fuscus]KAB7648188.1 tail tape measure protein [Polymorphobacter fuscus]MQT15686.1 tail tape measure protein [Polymorphobacter fuscus]NJC08043.1 phage-related minor tail protein [Polymorphobacter fuscus]
MTNEGIDLDTLVVRVRADTSGFMAGINDIRREVDGPLTAGIDRAGSSIERALTRAAATGKFGFEDLRRVAVTALADIAANAVKANIGAGAAGGGIASLIGAVGSLFGAPGRATGGPVSGGRPYLVGERGPELFVPAAAGRVETMARGRGAVNVTINVAAPREASAAVMGQTANQVARAVRQALARAEA